MAQNSPLEDTCMKTPQDNPQDHAKAIIEKDKELASVFTRLFNTPDGMTVLGQLNSQYFMSHVGPNQDHSYHMGQKDLMSYILATIQQGKL